MATSQQYPLVCSFREPIVGQGFVAGVDLQCRALAEREDVDGSQSSGWWVYGVYPGAVAGSGATLDVAVRDFRDRVKLVLIDFAHDANDFDAFHSEVQSFFFESDEHSISSWDAARKSVREGNTRLPGLDRVEEVPEPNITVKMIQLRPKENTVDQEPALAA